MPGSCRTQETNHGATGPETLVCCCLLLLSVVVHYCSTMSTSPLPPTSTSNALLEAKKVQAILQGTTCPRPVCTQCRVKEADLQVDTKMMKCTRCKVAHYCTRICQKKHFSFHKSSCRTIAELRAKAEANEEDISPNDLVAVQSTLGHLLVEMGYRETDTIENGSVYYRQALQHYIEVLHLNAEAVFDPTNALEDKILLLLVVLGADEETLREWMNHSGSPRKIYYDQESTGNSTKEEELPLDVTVDLVCKLSVRMRNLTLANQRQEEALHQKQQQLSKSIEQLVGRIESHGKGQYLVALRDNIPFNPQDAPDLFRGPETIREFWLLFQDCFFLTPGLNSVLHEFVPEL